MDDKNQTHENFLKTYKPFLEKLARLPQKQNEYMVYYDHGGNIKMVTPEESESMTKDYNVLKVLYEEIEGIIIGKQSTRNYYVEDQTLVKKKDVLKVSEDLLLQDNDVFVKPVTENEDAVVQFIVSDDSILVEIEPDKLTQYRRLLRYKLVTEENLNLSGSKSLTFFVADKTDPNMLIDSYSVSVRDLVIGGQLVVDGDFNWNEMAIYCKHFTELGIKEKE